MAQLPIERLLGSPEVDPQRPLDPDRVQQYAQLLDELPPITVFRLQDQTLLLADGYHRLAAAQAAGRATVNADVREGTKADALKFATDVAMRERGISESQARAAIKRNSEGRWLAEDR
jgi:ParB-like chromosome segregation protein Spo0J